MEIFSPSNNPLAASTIADNQASSQPEASDPEASQPITKPSTSSIAITRLQKETTKKSNYRSPASKNPTEMKRFKLILSAEICIRCNLEFMLTIDGVNRFCEMILGKNYEDQLRDLKKPVVITILPY